MAFCSKSKVKTNLLKITQACWYIAALILVIIFFLKDYIQSYLKSNTTFSSRYTEVHNVEFPTIIACLEDGYKTQVLLLLLLLRPAGLQDLPHICLWASVRIYPRSGRLGSYEPAFPQDVAFTHFLALPILWTTPAKEPTECSEFVLSDRRGHFVLSQTGERSWSTW